MQPLQGTAQAMNFSHGSLSKTVKKQNEDQQQQHTEHQ
jgi:hypothetical protein